MASIDINSSDKSFSVKAYREKMRDNQYFRRRACLNGNRLIFKVASKVFYIR